MTDKQIYQIGLTMINGVGDILARHLLEALGDAEAVFTEKRQSLEKISGIGDSIIAEIKRADVLLRAEKELAFAQKNGISIYFLKDELSGTSAGMPGRSGFILFQGERGFKRRPYHQRCGYS